MRHEAFVRSPLVDREDEVRSLARGIRQDRLTTLTGPPGAGKTRLAQEIFARTKPEYPGGSYWVDLAAASTADHVAPAILASVGSVEAGANYVAGIATAIGTKRSLIVLDGFEHVTEAAPLLTELLDACGSLAILVTSRTPLHVAGEREFLLSPLPPPGDTGEAPAVRLFVQRAQSVNPSFVLTTEIVPTVARLCERLDGLPLAIELAAAKTKLLTPAQLLERLAPAENSLRILSNPDRRAHPKHRSLRHTIAWSYDLLSPLEQRVLELVSVFPAGVPLSAVEWMSDALGLEPRAEIVDAVAALIDASLVNGHTDAPETRATMLQTVREFSFERLAERGHLGDALDARMRYFLGFAEAAERELVGSRQREWYDRLEIEYGNIMVVLEHALGAGTSKASENAARIIGMLEQFWMRHGHQLDGATWCRRALAALGSSGEAGGCRAIAIRAKLESVAGSLAWLGAEWDAAAAHHRRALKLCGMIAEPRGVGFSLSSLGVIALDTGDVERGASLLDRSGRIFAAAEDRWGAALVELNLGVCALEWGDVEAAAAHLERSLDLCDAIGDVRLQAVTAHNLADVARLRGDVQDARRRLELAVSLGVAGGDRRTAIASEIQLSMLECAAGHEAEALSGLLKCVREAEAERFATLAIDALDAAVGALIVLGALGDAAAVLAHIDASRAALQHQRSVADRERYDANLAVLAGRLSKKALGEAQHRGRSLSREEALACAALHARRNERGTRDVSPGP